jgi:hypothetical protein
MSTVTSPIAPVKVACWLAVPLLSFTSTAICYIVPKSYCGSESAASTIDPKSLLTKPKSIESATDSSPVADITISPLFSDNEIFDPARNERKFIMLFILLSTSDVP